ncbi:MAG: hypothetical protein CL912_14060 [Deltaproteobacteria bacterium]|nr:hypothetical protein [Deltaproteobacteria bacterium]
MFDGSGKGEANVELQYKKKTKNRPYRQVIKCIIFRFIGRRMLVKAIIFSCGFEYFRLMLKRVVLRNISALYRTQTFKKGFKEFIIVNQLLIRCQSDTSQMLIRC